MWKPARLGLVIIAVAIFGRLPLAQSSVNLINGNYYVECTDLSYGGALPLKIHRIYNSKTKVTGRFGVGWVSELDASISVQADGSVILHEYGGGVENLFSTRNADSSAQVDQDMNDILNAVAKTGGLSEDEKGSFKIRLLRDPLFRAEKWNLYKKSHLLPERRIPVGEVLYSRRFGHQTIQKTASGFSRKSMDGKQDDFDSFGKLLRTQDKDGNFIQYTYASAQTPSAMEDNFGHKISITVNSSGLIEKVVGSDGETTQYRYNEKKELISAQISGRTERYSYDSLHNLTEVAHPGGAKDQMTYFISEPSDNIKSIRNTANGWLTEYSYPPSTDPLDVKIIETIKGPKDQVISSEVIEYIKKRHQNGGDWLYETVQTRDGSTTETYFNECCSLPVRLKTGNDVFEYEYDDGERKTKEVTPTEIVKTDYDQQTGAILGVKRVSKKDGKILYSSQFQYDAKGRLDFAKSFLGSGLKFIYPLNGNAVVVVNEKKERVDFVLDENGRPIEFSTPSGEKVSVDYTNSGKVKNVTRVGGAVLSGSLESDYLNMISLLTAATLVGPIH